MNGGCEAPSCNVSQSLWIDLHGEIEEQVRTSGQFVTEEVIKKETSIRFMDLYVKDVKSIVKETSGEQVIEGEDLLITSQGIMTRVQDSLVSAEYEFITKRQEKGLEDPKESQTLREVMTAMLSSSDAEAFFPVHNKGADGSYQIRFMAHWKREGNRIKTEMITITEKGRDLSLPEANQVIKERFGKTVLQHHESADIAFVTEDVRTDAMRQPPLLRIEDSLPLGDTHAKPEIVPKKAEKVFHVPTDFILRVGDRTATHTKEAVLSLGSYALREVARPRHAPVVERIRMLFRKSEATRVRHREPITVAKIREKPVELREVIRQEHTEMRRTARALSIVAETRVAIGAVPFLIGTLAKEQSKAMKAVEKSVVRHERKMRKEQQRERITLAEIRKKPESLRKTMVKRHKEMKQTVRAVTHAVEMKAVGAIPFLVASLVKEQPKSIKAIEKSLKRHSRKAEMRRFTLKRREKKVVERKVRMTQVESQMKKKQKKEVRINVLEGSLPKTIEKRKKAKRLTRFATYELRVKKERIINRDARFKTKDLGIRKEKKQKMKVQFKNKDLRMTQENRKVFVENQKTKKERRTRRRKRVMQQRPEQVHAQRSAFEFSFALAFSLWKDAILLKKVTPWVLLTIIYYLAILREGGKPPVANKKKKKKKVEVVIYTYGS